MSPPRSPPRTAAAAFAWMLAVLCTLAPGAAAVLPPLRVTNSMTPAPVPSPLASQHAADDAAWPPANNCASPSSMGFDGTLADCTCWCNHQANVVWNTTDVYVRHVDPEPFCDPPIPGSCACCRGSGESVQGMPVVPAPTYHPDTGKRAAAVDGDGRSGLPQGPLGAYGCYNAGGCCGDNGYDGSESSCQSYCGGFKHLFMNAAADMKITYLTSDPPEILGGCSCCGTMIACDVQGPDDPSAPQYCGMPGDSCCGLDCNCFGGDDARAAAADSGESGMLATSGGTTADGSVLTPARAEAQPPTPWFFSLHSGECANNMTRCAAAFGLIAKAGAKGVRTDIFWSAVEPTQGGWDDDAMAFFTDFFVTAAEAGLDAIPIVSGPPAWATALFKNESTRPAFFDAYGAYAKRAITALAQAFNVKGLPMPTRYQLFNELNAIPSMAYSSDMCGMITVASQALREVEAKLKVRGNDRAHNDGATKWTFYVNVEADMPFWDDYVTKWVDPECAGGAFDAIGIDAYPGTWALGAYSQWTPLDTLLSRVANTSDAWHGKIPAILETGFSTWWPGIGAGYSQQVQWVNQSLGVVHDKVRAYKAQAGVPPFGVLNAYELVDGDTKAQYSFPPEEDHFGFVETWDDAAGGYVEKPAFAELARVIGAWNEEQ